jgi:sulfur-carrier protein adenylyltransferase/sulfurtransferase
MEKPGLPDKRWLFPERAETLVEAHENFFQNMPTPGRSLSFHELRRYVNYPAGWRIAMEVAGKWIKLDVLMDENFPFSDPRIALSEGDYHLVWPHIEENGLLCLRSSADMINHDAGIDLTVYYIEEAKKLLEDSLTGNTREDFATEFRSYWSRWRIARKGSLSPIWLLSKPMLPSRKIYLGCFKGENILCDSIEKGLHWAKTFTKGKNIKEDQFKQALFMWLDHPLMPEKYPKHNSHVAELARQSRCFDLLLSIVPDQPDYMYVIFGFDTKNGPALGAVRLNEPVALNAYKKRPVYSRFKGNRPTTAKTRLVKERYFNTEGKADPMEVQRIDRQWIFMRGGTGLNPKLDEARVCLIGCGSLGAQVAKHIVQSGIQKLILIDPDLLSWDNIGRHLLGADDVGKNKTSCLKGYLDTQFPDMLEIKAEPLRWQELFADKAKKDLIKKSDIIISTLGNWDSEAALNYAFNSNAEFPPIVFGWTEPFGVAGHALLITGLGGCLSCGMDSKGVFKYALSRWSHKNHLRRVPACGETYQPYGIIDIAPIQAMIARLAVDVILGNSKTCEHRAWIGRVEDINPAGGTLWDGASEYYGDLGTGFRQIEKKWEVNSSCRYQH